MGSEAVMTNVQYSPEMGAQMRAATTSLDGSQDATSFGVMANLAGAILSLALIAGIAVWGYNLMVRDVTGIPIVRAAEGDMRVLPDEPGGLFAQNQGLAVNTIAAEGRASGRVDSVTLAPSPVVLQPDDAPAVVEQPAPLAPADSYIDAATQDAADGSVPALLEAGEVDAVVSELIASMEAEAAQSLVATETGTAAENGTDTFVEQQDTPAVPTVKVHRVAIDAAGPRQSIRPRLRPALVQKAAFVTSQPKAEIDPAAIPTGTRLAQLGAFDSADIARAEWQRLETQFGKVLSDKSRVVQKVSSSGREFFRLRAMGFRDLNDARRFCSAFKAEGVDCIPVASR